MLATTGPIFNHIEDLLSSYPFYRQFRAGKISRSVYTQMLDKFAEELKSSGLSEHDLKFASRFPQSEEDFVEKILLNLYEHGVIPSTEYDRESFNEYARQMSLYFDHKDFCTYIYPEEARLLYALVEILKPQSTAFLGSYYGYWAFWALEPIYRAGGHAYLVDVNPQVSPVIHQNIKIFGYGDCTSIITDDAVAFVQKFNQVFDLVVIDAENDESHPNPDYRGKAVYYPILMATLDSLKSTSVVLCHNIILDHFCGDPFFDQLIERNSKELSKFFPLVQTQTKQFLKYPSTEGVGIGFISDQATM